MTEGLVVANEEGEIAMQAPSLLEIAIEKGAPIETLEKLMALQERHEKNEAKKAFHVAMAKFKLDPPKIERTKKVDYGQTHYRHADLAKIASLIGEALSKNDLSAAWRTEKEDGKSITVTCVITHVLGHSESTSLTAPHDTSGSKNAIQAMGSTISYLQRYTILSLTGLAAGDMDDDGGGGEEEPITKDQLVAITALIASTKSDIALFCTSFNIDTLEDLPASDCPRAMALLEAKKQAQGAK